MTEREPLSDPEPGRLDDFAERVEGAIREYGMLERGEKVLAAVSGGADSVCLLHVLNGLGYSVEVAHFDHQTRNGESAEDAAFVRGLANELGLPFHVESRPVEDEAQGSEYSFEEYARNARYEFLFRTAEKRGCAAVATGHHADDQVETVLMRVLRGTAPAGVGGIRPVGERHGVRVVRPLVGCRRREIVEYLEQRQLPYREDRTNQDIAHVRNRVRHVLLPMLEQDFNPRVRDALLRLAEMQRGDNELLDSLTEVPFEECVTEDGTIARERFQGLHPAVQRRIAMRLAWRYGIECPYDRVQGAVRFILAGATGREFDLGGGIRLQNGRDVTRIHTRAEGDAAEGEEVTLAVPGATAAFGKVFTVMVRERAPSGGLAAYCSPSRQVFGAEALGTDLVVRPRRSGDTFTPLGMQGSKRLKRYFADIGLPAWERPTQLVLVAGGRIAWVVGLAMGAEFSVADPSAKVVEIEVSDAAQ